MSNHFNETISIKRGTALYVGAVLGSGILILRYDSECSRRECDCFSLVMIALSIPLAFTFAFID